MVRAPILIFASSDEAACAHLQCVCLLGAGTTDGNHLIGTESLRVQQTEMSKTTNANNADTFSRSTAVVFERRVYRDTST